MKFRNRFPTWRNRVEILLVRSNGSSVPIPPRFVAGIIIRQVRLAAHHSPEYVAEVPHGLAQFGWPDTASMELPVAPDVLPVDDKHCPVALADHEFASRLNGVREVQQRAAWTPRQHALPQIKCCWTSASQGLLADPAAKWEGAWTPSPERLSATHRRTRFARSSCRPSILLTLAAVRSRIIT